MVEHSTFIIQHFAFSSHYSQQMRPILAVCLLISIRVGSASAQAPPPAQPDAPAAYYFMLGRHLEDADKIDEAIAAHKKAIELEPQSAELRAELAALYARQDRAREAMQTAEAALERDPANREANRVVGSVYAALSEQRRPFRPGDDPAQYPAKGIAALEKSRRESGFDINLELMLGRLYITTRDYDKAIASLRRVVEDQPGYVEGAMLLSAAQEASGLVPEAIGTLEGAVEYNPTSARALVHLAELYDQQHQYQEAADAYGRAGAANARVDVAARRAAALINAGKAADARKILEEAVGKKTPPDAAVLYMLSQAQRQLKDYDAAAATALRLKTAYPDDTRGAYLNAQLLQDRGRTAEAITAFQDLIKRAPQDAALVYEYSALLDRAGRLPDAERALRDLLSKDPLDANALNSLGYMLADHGQRLDEAVDLVQRALKVEPGNPSFLDSLGWAYLQQGKIDLADPPLTQAAEQLPASSTVQDHLGDLRFKQQRYADAVAAWEKSLAGDGESIDRTQVEKKARDARARVWG
jgi:tetratricopeptide (TPR) repeat protein